MVLDETVQLTGFTYKFPNHHHARRRTAWSKGTGNITFDSSVFGGRCQRQVRLNIEGLKGVNDNILACQSLYKLLVGVDKFDDSDGNAATLEFLNRGLVD